MKDDLEKAIKLIYFKRSPIQGLGFFAGDWGRGVYIPKEEIILFKGKRKVYGFPRYYVSDDPKILKEINDAISAKIQRFEIPIENAYYHEIREVEFKDSEITELVQNIKLNMQLKGKIKSGIERLIGPKR